MIPMNGHIITKSIGSDDTIMTVKIFLSSPIGDDFNWIYTSLIANCMKGLMPFKMSTLAHILYQILDSNKGNGKLIFKYVNRDTGLSGIFPSRAGAFLVFNVYLFQTAHNISVPTQSREPFSVMEPTEGTTIKLMMHS